MPSPQSIVAVKSLSGAAGLASVNEATGPLKNGRTELRNREDGRLGRVDGGWVGEAVKRRVGDDGRAGDDRGRSRQSSVTVTV